jgi:hypothetical protein
MQVPQLPLWHSQDTFSKMVPESMPVVAPAQAEALVREQVAALV